VQERYNELDKLEADKNEVRRQIEALEREHAERVAAFEKEQQRARQLWAERRAEAEKARELYERNTSLVEKRLEEVVRREQEHARRAEELAEKTSQVAERERRLRTLEERVRLLEEQRDSLNQVITNLTTRVGKDWSSPEATLESGSQPPGFDVDLGSAPGTPVPAGARNGEERE
jgi:chromosome segregation ATPase